MTGFLGLLPPVSGSLACGGGQHNVRWADGGLVLPDHADPEGERILAALGGQRAGCIALLEAWHRCSSDVTLLPAFTTLSDRVRASMGGSAARPGVQLVGGLAATLSSTIRQGRLPRRNSGAVSDDRAIRDDLLLLLSAGAGLVDRLAVQTLSAWALRAEVEELDADVRIALGKALASRVSTTLAGWVGADRATATVELTDRQDAAHLLRAADGWRATLPPGWLARVWAPGLAVTAGRFVVSAAWDGDMLRLNTVGADGRAGEMTVGPVPAAN
jgi:hypothetical protein